MRSSFTLAPLVTLLAAAPLVACTAPSGDEDQSSVDPGALSAGQVQVWITSDRHHPLEQKPVIDFHDPTIVAGSRGTLTVDDSSANLRQAVDGFGAALTDASAAILYHQLDAAQRTAVLEKLMSPKTGLGLNMLRLPIAASDSTWDGAYSYDTGAPDPSLSRFSVAHDATYILPQLEEILGKINPDVHIIATPWSPPAWMKEGTGSMIGGTLRPEYRAAYADYLVRFVRAYWEQPVHIPIYALTPQNEPGQPANYPSMTLPASDEATFIHDFLAPALDKAHFGWVKILGFDHNWGDSYPEDLLGDLAAQHALDTIDGMAFHCYGGNHSGALTTLHDDPRMAGKDIYLTECDRSETPAGVNQSYAEGIEKLIYAMNNWSRSYLAWQLVLHPDGTPNQGSGCMHHDSHGRVVWHCVGVVSVDPSTHAVEKQWDYAYLGHASKHVARGARVVSLHKLADIESVAFVNPDGTRVLVAYNASEDTEETFQVEWHGHAFTASIPKRSAATFRWGP